MNLHQNPRLLEPLKNSAAVLGVLRTEIDLGHDWMLNLAYRGQHYENDFIATVPTITNNAGGYSINAIQSIPQNYFNTGGQAIVSGKLQTGPLRHEITFGTDIQKDSATGGGQVPFGPFASNLFRPVYYPEPTRVPKPDFRLLDSLATTAFASDLVSFPGDVVQVLGAFRWADINYATFDRNTNLRTLKTDQDKVVPIGALLIHPTPETLLYASYAQGFERGGLAPNTAANAGLSLPPISSEQIEVGGKATLAGVTASLALFRIDRALEYVDTATNRFVQNGRQVHEGIEFALSGEPIEGVRLLGGVTGLDPVVRRTGNPLTEGRDPIGVPRIAVSTYGEYDLPWVRGLTLTGGVYYTGREFYDLTNQRSVTPGARVDLGLRYDTLFDGVRATFRLGVENVADRYYWAAATASGLALASPRTIKASVQLRW